MDLVKRTTKYILSHKLSLRLLNSDIIYYINILFLFPEDTLYKNKTSLNYVI